MFLIKSHFAPLQGYRFSPSLSRKGMFDPCPSCSHVTEDLPFKTRCCLSPSFPHSLPFPFLPPPRSHTPVSGT